VQRRLHACKSRMRACKSRLRECKLRVRACQLGLHWCKSPLRRCRRSCTNVNHVCVRAAASARMLSQEHGCRLEVRLCQSPLRCSCGNYTNVIYGCEYAAIRGTSRRAPTIVLQIKSQHQFRSFPSFRSRRSITNTSDSSCQLTSFPSFREIDRSYRANSGRTFSHIKPMPQIHHIVLLPIFRSTLRTHFRFRWRFAEGIPSGLSANLPFFLKGRCHDAHIVTEGFLSIIKESDTSRKRQSRMKITFAHTHSRFHSSTNAWIFMRGE
jgi:hypothetical protein